MAGMGLNLSTVRGISVSGQQHGTVYWAKGAGQRLNAMAGSEGEDTSDQTAAGGVCGHLECLINLVCGNLIPVVLVLFSGCSMVSESRLHFGGILGSLRSVIETAMGSLHHTELRHEDVAPFRARWV